MGSNVMEFRYYVIISVRGGERLYIQDFWIRILIRRSTVAPLSPIAGNIARFGQHVTHSQVVCPNRFFGVIPIVLIGEGMPLMETGLLRGAGRRAHCATIGASESDPFAGKAVQCRGDQMRLTIGFALELPIRAQGSPTHIVHIKVKDVWPKGRL